MKRDSARMQKETCKGTMPLMLNPRWWLLEGWPPSLISTPQGIDLNRIQNILLSDLEEEVSFIDIHKIISKVKSSVAKVSSYNSS